LALALAVKVPTVLLLMVSVQVRVLASTTVGVPHVLVLARSGVGLTLGVIVPKVGGVATPSGMAITVMVKVCGWPTSLVALGAMLIEASTYFLTAGPEPPGPLPMVAVAG